MLLSFYFVVNISVAVLIFINFYCKLIVMKIYNSQSYNLKHYIVFVYFLLQINSCTDCSFVKMTYYLNPNLVLNLCVVVVLQSIITLIANFSSIKTLLHYFLVSFIRFSDYINHNYMICSTKFFSSSFISHLIIFS